MNILFLGTGTSTGVPQIGCRCKTCTSIDSKDKRLRASVLIAKGETQILIDCGPDLRQQLLTNRVNHLSAILLTHEHYDHVGGLDDVRPLGEAQLYAEKKVLKIIQRNMPYCFGDNKYPGVPSIHLHEINENAFIIDELNIQPIRIMHAELPILGFRVENVAYLTDVKTIEKKSLDQLKNLDILIINALRPNKHISHLSLTEAIDMATKIGARKTYFTHMSHDMGLHRDVNQILPENFQLAYDGLKLSI
ncbi:MAG: MBL fold metallo-hydrolase [Paludibacter sp.]|nr:MBL fold metallo-hydrolase [Paludibacter sp.]